MLPAKLRNRDAALSLAQNRQDLGFTISRQLHANLLEQFAEKILLINPLNFRGDYRSAAALELQQATKYSIKQQSMRWWLPGMFGSGTFIGIMLFIGIANLMPSSAGTWMASAIFGGDPWTAGETLMSQADPVSFNRMIDLYQACPQSASVEVCRAAIAVKAAVTPTQ